MLPILIWLCHVCHEIFHCILKPTVLDGMPATVKFYHGSKHVLIMLLLEYSLVKAGPVLGNPSLYLSKTFNFKTSNSFFDGNVVNHHNYLVLFICIIAKFYPADISWKSYNFFSGYNKYKYIPYIHNINYDPNYKLKVVLHSHVKTATSVRSLNKNKKQTTK